MKLIILLMFLFSCSSQTHKKQYSINHTDLPPEVKKSFEARHPRTEPTFLIQETNFKKTFEANFKIDSTDWSERYTNDGDLIETKEEISMKDIPKSVQFKIQNFLRDHYARKTTKIEKVKSDSFNGFQFKVNTTQSETGLMEYFFEANGEIHHQEQVIQ